MRNSLTKIVINHSSLNCIPDIELCPMLEMLDLSFNNISNVPDLTAKFPKLNCLLLNSNQIHQLDSLVNVSKSSNIRELDLRNNPIFEIRDFKSFILKKIPLLLYFNGELVVQTLKTHDSNWDNFFFQNASTQAECLRPMSIRTTNGRDSSALEQNYYRSLIKPPTISHFNADTITILELDDCQLLDLNQLPDR